jgi:hypothetical protein
MFWQNLRQVFSNLPLVLSDSYDPKDVSLNRLASFLLIIAAIIIQIVIIKEPTFAEKLQPVLNSDLTALGGLLLNITARRGINAYTQIKGGNQGEASNISGAKTTSITEQK